MDRAGKCSSKPLVTSGMQAELNNALVWVGVGRTARVRKKARELGCGSSSPSRRGMRTCKRQGMARSVCGTRDTGGPGGEAGSGSIPGAACRGRRGRAGALGEHPVGGGDARRALQRAGLKSSARPQPPAPPEAPRPAPSDRSPAPWTEAAVRRKAVPTLVAWWGGENRAI